MIDFTVTEDMKAGWKRKKQKYENTAFGDVILVVVSPNFEMHSESIRALAKYLNVQHMYRINICILCCRSTLRNYILTNRLHMI